MADLTDPTTDVTLFDNESNNYADINSDHELLVHDQEVIDALTGVAIVKKRWYSINFMNAGSPSLLVNGTTTPVVFSVAPTAGEVWYVQSVVVNLLDSGAMDYNKFGTLTVLTNGLIFEAIIDSTTSTICNVKDNMDLMGHFHDSPFTMNSTAGFLSTSDVFMGQAIFEPAMVLTGDDGDSLQFRVRDNLTALDYLKIFCHVYKEV